ncbi:MULTISPECIES: hypothetical protein [unclassified Pseudoalteromonas]|uniref:hypothetical protein n=1 Tax=unclassified Pseudoalteromonas TaxID=194690 RepID=UPI00041D0B4C|nr:MULTISPECIES: hypothetical protein [unclassified Pseudoalteromonas]
MCKSDKAILLGISLVFIAGIIVGQTFSFEIKLSDLIATLVAIITFYYAFQGLQHNKRIYQNSIKPVIERFISVDNEKYVYNFQLKNYGTGSAINLKYKILSDAGELSHKDLQQKLLLFGDMKLEIGAELGISPNSSLNIITMKMSNEASFTEVIKYLGTIELHVNFSSIQDDVQDKVFSLTP